MIILWDNKIIDATLTADTENENYPLTNLQDTVIAKRYRSTADNVIVKSSTQTRATYFCILGHNLSAGAVITLQGNNTDSWGSPSFSQTVEWDSAIIIHNFTQATYNYWRVVITDDDTGTDGYIEIGLLYLGTALQMPGMAQDQIVIDGTESKTQISTAGQAYGDRRFVYRNFKINFLNISHDKRAEVREMWNGVHNVQPIIVLLWGNRLGYESIMYAVIDQDKMEWQKGNSYLLPWKTTIQLREVF